MKTSKEVYSKCFKEYQITGDKLTALQSGLLEMLVEIKDVFDRNGIHYMLSGGTLLGAVRHHGFIPWDDDIDLMMLRTEYEQFAEVFEKELGDRYILAQPLKTERYFSKMPKIYKKGTTYVEIPTAGTGGPDMLFLDVFIIENVPAPGIWRNIKAFIYDVSFKAASVCLDYKYPSPVIEQKAAQDDELKEYYGFRRRVGFIFSLFGGIRFYLKVCDIIARQKKETGWLGVPSAISYKREIFHSEVFSILEERDFCGYSFTAPAAYDEYLTNLYGNYMQIPPEEKREYHAAYKIEL